MKRSVSGLPAALSVCFLALGLALAFSACGKKEPGASSPAAAAVETRPVYKNPLAGYLRTPAPLVLSQKIVALVGQLDPSGQGAFMLPMVLAQTGYPQYDGVSPDAPMGLAFLLPAGTTEPVPVLLLRASDQAALLQFALAQGKMVSQRQGEWVLLAPNQEALGLVVDPAELIALAGQTPVFDLHATLLPDGLLAARPQILETLRQSLGSPDAQVLPPGLQSYVLGTIETALDELQATRSLEFGLLFEPEHLTMGAALDALNGTPLASLLGQKTAGRGSAGQFISGAAPIAWAGDYDPAASVAYGDHWVKNLQPRLTPEARATLQDAWTRARPLYAGLSGPFAGSLEFTATGLRQIQYQEGSLQDAQVRDLMTWIVNDFLQPLLAGLTTNQDDIRLDIAFTPAAAQVAGLPAHRLTVKIASVSPNLSPEEVAAMSRSLPQETWFTVVKGGVLSANQLTDLETHASAIKAGRPLPAPVSASLTPRPGALAQGRMDVVAYYLGIFTFLGQDEAMTKAMGPFLPVLEKLRAEQLPPATFDLTTSPHRSDFRLRYPLATLKRIIAEAHQAAQAAPKPSSS